MKQTPYIKQTPDAWVSNFLSIFTVKQTCIQRTPLLSRHYQGSCGCLGTVHCNTGFTVLYISPCSQDNVVDVILVIRVSLYFTSPHVVKIMCLDVQLF